MKICGIIAEYNPFHNGHLHHIQEAIKITGAEAVVVIMSGNFVQRGEPAIMDKWTRAKMALKNGVDCIFELPVYFATASAQDFAKGSVHLLEKLGVDYLCFGSELGNIEILSSISNYMATSEYHMLIKQNMEEGHNYSKSMKLAIDLKFPNIELKSNDYLGISYIQEILKNHYSITPYCIPRISSDYNDIKLSDTNENIASASAIRYLMLRRSVNMELITKFIPNNCLSDTVQYPISANLEMLHQSFNAIFIREFPQNIGRIRGMREGIENRISEKLTIAKDLNHMIEDIITRRYSHNSISRLIINTILGIFELEPDTHMDYVRILGFNSSKPTLKELKRRSELYFISNMARDLKKYQKKNPLIDLDIRASKIYSLINSKYGLDSEYMTKPIMEH